MARLTGWGQTGPLAPAAGHDINYCAVSGALAMLASARRETREGSTASVVYSFSAPLAHRYVRYLIPTE